MFAVLNKIEKPDPKLTLSIRKLADQILLPRNANLSKPQNLNDFSSATSKISETFVITPVNIALVTESIRFVASSKGDLDDHLQYLLKTVLEVLFPSEWI